MSCGRIAYVDEYFYLYNFGIGTNDLTVDGKKQKEIADYVKNKKKYSCIKQVWYFNQICKLLKWDEVAICIEVCAHSCLLLDYALFDYPLWTFSSLFKAKILAGESATQVLLAGSFTEYNQIQVCSAPLHRPRHGARWGWAAPPSFPHSHHSYHQ